MNNKNLIFSVIVMISVTTSILPMKFFGGQEEELRRNYLCQLSQAKVLTIAQYFENGAFSKDLIERDIAILQNDSQQAIKNKDWAEGYFYSWMLPGFAKLAVVGSGFGALAGGIATVVGSALTYDVWNSSTAVNFADKFYSPVIKASCNNLPDRIEAYSKYWDVKAQYLADQSDYNESVLAAAPVLPFVFVATLILTGFSKYSSKKLVNYTQRNAYFIQEMQARYNCNQVAIAQLQQIAYNANHLR